MEPQVAAKIPKPESLPVAGLKPAKALAAALRRVELEGYADGIGFAALLGFAMTAWATSLFKAVGLFNELALAVCWLMAAASREARAALFKDRVFLFSLLCAAYLVVQTAWGAASLPETWDRQWLDCGKFLLLLGFLPVAWLLKANLARINLVLAAALSSLLVGMQPYATLEEMLGFQVAWQTGFQMTVACSSLISATALLGLLLWVGPILSLPGSGWLKGILGLAWLAAAYLNAYILVASQSRALWLAALIVFPVAMGLRHFRPTRTRALAPARLAYFPVLAVVGLLLGGMLLNADSLLARIGPDKATAALILRGETDHLPESSFAYRFYIQKFGVEKWLERPLIGWGTGSTKYLIKTSGQPALFNRPANHWMGHLHNSLLEILVRFGLIGLAIAGFGFWLWFKAIAAAAKAGRIPRIHLLFLTGAAALTAVRMLTAFPVLLMDWAAYWLLLAGAGYSFALRREEPRPSLGAAVV
jgi:O-antigen ligase